MRGFRLRSILYSERCAHICLAPSQNSNVRRRNIHVWTHFEPIFSLRVHGWIQTTVTQLAGVCGCRRKRQLSFFTIGCCLFKQFSPSRNRFLRRTPTGQDRFAFRQLLWPDYSTYKSFDSSMIIIIMIIFCSNYLTEGAHSLQARWLLRGFLAMRV